MAEREHRPHSAASPGFGKRADSGPGVSAHAADAFRCRTRELVRYLTSTFQSLLPPEKAGAFERIGPEVERALEDNCRACQRARQDANPEPPQDPRRNRFLLRLVLGRVSHHFTGPRATMPRSLIEGLDRYLRKAFGEIIYEELNAESNQVLSHVNIDDDDRLMWERIRKSPQMCRFVDTIFIRILFRFESFAAGKKVFISILDRTMQEISHVSFGETEFYAIFEDLFSYLWLELQNEEQRLRWDFMFGDGTSKRLHGILSEGLARWLKRQEGGAALATQRAAATIREQTRLAAKGLADAPQRPSRRA